MTVSPDDRTYFQRYYATAGETYGGVGYGVKTLTSFKSSYLRGDPWVIYVSFNVNTLNNSAWKPIVGSMYSPSITAGWGIWISPTYKIHWRNGSYTADFNTLSISKVDTYYELTVSLRSSGALSFQLREVYNASTTLVSDSVTTTAYWDSISTLQPVTAGGWVNSSERFPGKIETIVVGQHATDYLIKDLTPFSAPIEQGSFTSFVTNNISFVPTTRTSSLTSSLTSVLSIASYGLDSWGMTAGAIGSTTVQSIILDTTGFYPPINTSVVATVIKSLITATLTASQSVIIVKYILSSTVPFVIVTNNTEAFTRTHSSGTPSVATIPNSSTATAQIAGVGVTLISVTQSATTKYTSVSSPNIITLAVIGQNGSYSGINMTSADLSATNVSSSVFTNCNLTAANLYNSTVNSATDFSTATLTGLKSGRITGLTTRLPSGFKMI
jgi:hypothetical protein